MLKILTVVGARPQFIKAAAFSRQVAIDEEVSETIVHTGQHFDQNMSEVFFREMGIPAPKYNLGIAGLAHGAMTGRMLEQLETIIHSEHPSCVMVYGDTNSTLAGALAASKIGIPVVHVEAGLRSHNMKMPEEINRIVTDRLSHVLLCPSQASVDNLMVEGFPFESADQRKQHIRIVGDIMYDCVLSFRNSFAKADLGLNSFQINSPYAVCTLHRQENSSSPERLKSILAALIEYSEKCEIIFPVHPRMLGELDDLADISGTSKIKFVDPVPYFQMQNLIMNASIVFTDSGGLQKEAFFHKVPCVTLRDETEWVETLETGWNIIAGADCNMILAAANKVINQEKTESEVYGKGDTARQIIEELKDYL